ncbi:hypothetical protein ACQP0C_12770 [Nocardia sp. CA-129566]|uniref:hypothetical protein n=1 Tax=Nocardia sp. CA-129566 TaxID=3239976 RepID=UPI003D993C06
MLMTLAGNTSTSAAADLHYQCDSAVGPDPAVTTTSSATTSRRAADTIPESEVPTTNPYAEWTIAPDDTDASDWQRSCASAMRSASWQLPPLQTVNTGLAVECARQYALAVARNPATLEPGRNGAPGTVDAATLSKSVIDAASGAAMTGQCLQAAAGTGGGAVGSSSGATMPRTESPQVACGRPSSSTTTARSAVVLPSAIAAQGVCGQRVDAAAVSPGDLVFWDYRSNAPTRVGVAVDATQIITVDPDSGQVVEQVLPTGGDVRVKRVLKGDS